LAASEAGEEGSSLIFAKAEKVVERENCSQTQARERRDQKIFQGAPF
jgi:hypothetical protein